MGTDVLRWMETTHHMLRRSSAGSRGKQAKVLGAALAGAMGSGAAGPTASTLVAGDAGDAGGDGSSVTVTEREGAEAPAFLLCGSGGDSASRRNRANCASVVPSNTWRSEAIVPRLALGSPARQGQAMRV